MDENTYKYLIKSESAARKYLTQRCYPSRHRYCPRCLDRRGWRLKNPKYRRCAQCGYTYHDFSGRWISIGQLSCRTWLRIVRMFELNFTASQMAQELGLTYNTVYKAVTVIRDAIVAHTPDAACLLASNGGNGSSKGNGSSRDNGSSGQPERRHPASAKIPVFSIREMERQVELSVNTTFNPKAVLELNVPKSRHGCVVYTDRYDPYDTLLFSTHHRRSSDKMVAYTGSNLYVDRHSAFWRFVKERLSQHHGISPRHFPLYFKELEFRFNTDKSRIFDQILSFICDLVPVQGATSRKKFKRRQTQSEVTT